MGAAVHVGSQTPLSPAWGPAAPPTLRDSGACCKEQWLVLLLGRGQEELKQRLGPSQLVGVQAVGKGLCPSLLLCDVGG